MHKKTAIGIGCLIASLMIGLSIASAAEKINTDPKQKLPDPDGKPADMTKPVKVFILMGQSNMLGFGSIGSLQSYIQKGKYPHLVDDAGKWTERKDVRNVRVMNFKDYENNWLTGGTGFKRFGPELQFGYIMGHVLDEPVLILKSCIGNRSLGWDLLPPGSKQFEFEGRIYAGYKESPLSWVKGTTPKPIGWYAGKQYDDDTASAKQVLKNLAKYYPGYKDQGYEVAGFVFWQGHKDQNAAHASRYEFNLVNFIKSLRKDFNAPNAKFAIATIAFGGMGMTGNTLKVAEAQLAVSGEKGKYPEFKGNVKSFDARPFWRGGGAHYGGNAETYMEVGNGLGWAMAEMLKNKK